MVKSFNSPSSVCAPTTTGAENVVRSHQVELYNVKYRQTKGLQVKWSDPLEVMSKEVVQ